VQKKEPELNTKAQLESKHSQLSLSSEDSAEKQKAQSEKLAFSDHGEEDLWENLERAKGAKANYSDTESSNTSQGEPEKNTSADTGMTIAQFLGQDSAANVPEQKQSSLLRKEIQGTKEERILQINNYSQTLRPQGKVVAIPKSSHFGQEHIVTLIELESSTSKKGKMRDTYVFAASVNDKLPWFQVPEAPEQFV
jgi:hypothetical protein